MSVIEIDTDTPCVTPRRAPEQLAAEAIAQLAFELITIEDALRKGAVLTDQQRSKLRSIGERMIRRAA